MLFNSFHFLLFFPTVCLVYYIVPKKLRLIWLLVSSYYFYLSWNPKYIILILVSTAITYFCGLILDRIRHANVDDDFKSKMSQVVLVIAIIANLGMLFFYKYFNFFSITMSRISHYLHLQIQTPVYDIILPVGISFYTFQVIGYVIDVYKGKILAEKNFVRYALFVSFFPQLVAGPIEKAGDLLTQFKKPQTANWKAIKEGFLLIIWGLFLKLVIADRAALFIDTIYGDITQFTGWYLIIATVLFSIQIYCDFCGYSTIAIGAAKIFGINLSDNFDAPYLSRSTMLFWRRWHITLSQWFKDYVYIPLGGNRRGKKRHYLNLLIVFLISGLWHGAKFTYIVWGGLNGLFQIMGDIMKPIRIKTIKFFHLHPSSIGHRLLQVFITFNLICFSWIFFRAANISQAISIIDSIIHAQNHWILFDGSLYECGLDQQNFILLLMCICILISADILKRRQIKIREIIMSQDYWFQCLIVSLSICAILVFGIWGSQYDQNNFIYFQF